MLTLLTREDRRHPWHIIAFDEEVFNGENVEQARREHLPTGTFANNLYTLALPDRVATLETIQRMNQPSPVHE